MCIRDRLWIGDAEVVGGNAGARRRAAAHQCGVAGRGFGDGMVLLTMREEDPFTEQPAEPAGEFTTPALEIVWAELVDGQRDRETDPRPGRCLGDCRGPWGAAYQ